MVHAARAGPAHPVRALAHRNHAHRILGFHFEHALRNFSEPEQLRKNRSRGVITRALNLNAENSAKRMLHRNGAAPRLALKRQVIIRDQRKPLPFGIGKKYLSIFPLDERPGIAQALLPKIQ